MPGELVGPESRLAELSHRRAPAGRIKVRQVPGRPRPRAARRSAGRGQAGRGQAGASVGAVRPGRARPGAVGRPAAARSPQPLSAHLRSFAAISLPQRRNVTDQSPRICPTTCGKSVDCGMCRRCAEGPVRAPGYPPRLASPARAADPAGPSCCWTASAPTAAGVSSSSTTARRRRRTCMTSPAPSRPRGSPITGRRPRLSTSRGCALAQAPEMPAGAHQAPRRAARRSRHRR